MHLHAKTIAEILFAIAYLTPRLKQQLIVAQPLENRISLPSPTMKRAKLPIYVLGVILDFCFPHSSVADLENVNLHKMTSEEYSSAA